ncbi:extracellular sulfatase Sulf-2 [Colletotrichum tamarilloi]|uniref:Extracellular sulfatase Sulf-2 n=1 Tax=Colletotrichum tamarilloi TaxID=1209934 RepID=A0ABQ9QUD2_9PEZI|nr:extracellular sulfatase Sulf-2 [Colletotrichum tamarilloi]KAK1485407.1 extracellular sulfatase Sulf-2 [Colletotrichum tamarilloi]
MTDTRPNILFIMADDHASKAVSAYGAGINHTPNIDRLAAEGMKFNHCYVTNSICTPSRAAILTGTHNHVNGVMTLNDNINKHLPNVAKHMRTGGYRTAMVGKWHLGEGRPHEPTGFDYWSVLPGQGDYWDPEFIEPAGEKVEDGYVTDIITDKCLDWISKTQNTDKPFFLMCHHKAPHRSWECDEKHKDLYKDPIRVPETYDDDYKNRAKAAKVAKMRVAEDMTYQDLGLVQPDGGNKVGERVVQEAGSAQRKIPVDAKRLIDKEDGTVFTFKSQDDLAHFKFQRYMQRYLRTIQSVDDNVGRMLDYLEENGLAENTIVIYTSDQGFFLGEHGWFDKRFMYEESFQMPFLIRYPAGIAKGSVCDDIICNVDFAPTFLDFANLHIPSYMQGESFRQLLEGNTPADWQQIAYHRYWMHNDIIHHAYAHYGVRDQRYKLIYWYNEPLEASGARPGGEKDKEWELFDCEKDPLELFNVYHDPAYAEKVKHMTRLLELKMEQIGDEPVHPRGVDTGGSVKCEGGSELRCGTCARLGLDCSLAAIEEVGPDFHFGKQQLVSTKPRRLRGTRACKACRDKKVRCSGTSPRCTNCARHARECTYPTPARSARASSPQSTSTEGDESCGVEVGQFLPGAVESFFEKVYPLPSHAFLHPETTRERCREGRIDSALAHAICALATLHCGSDLQTRDRATPWVQTAEQKIWQHLESPTIPRLQALLLVIHYQMETGKFQRAFMLTATAARFAAAMRLNHERPDLDFVAQEVRRRVMWSLKITERYFSVGLPEFEACPIETIYLQYPSDENDFSNDGECGDGASYRLYVRLEITRRDIMKLTRGVTLCDQPFLPLTKLIGDFESDLGEIGSLLPDGTNFSMVNIGALEGDRWLRRRLFMHISFHQAHCDLYRILLSGYPEAAPRVVLEAVDMDYITMAEQNCLKHATTIIQILTSLNQHSTELLLLEFDTAICAYHATRLLLFIARAQRTPGCPSPEFALSRAALCLAALQRFFPSSALVKPIIDDMERLSRGHAPQEAGIGGLSSPEFQEGRRNLEQRLSEVAKARQRLAIHSLLRQADFTDEDEGDDYSSSMSASGLSPIMIRRTP